jgi:hypothetical protein
MPRSIVKLHAWLDDEPVGNVQNSRHMATAIEASPLNRRRGNCSTQNYRVVANLDIDGVEFRQSQIQVIDDPPFQHLVGTEVSRFILGH